MARPSPATAKTERLLNLVIALLSTRQPLSKAWVRAHVAGYQGSESEAFERMFERDKDELRAIGVPLRTEPVDPFFDDEVGYRIDRREYAVPEIDFTPDELAVIGLASRAWSQASLAGPAAQAVRKLEASGVSMDPARVSGIEPLLHTSEPTFEAARDAVLARREVTFDYRRSGSSATTARQVQPWGLTSWHGRWYLTGLDVDKDAPRVFRLDRVDGTLQAHGDRGAYAVPAEHEPRVLVTSTQEPAAGEPVTASVLLREGRGHGLRRAATGSTPECAGWDRLELQVSQLAVLAGEVAGLGPDARALHPPALVERVRDTLAATVLAHEDVA